MSVPELHWFAKRLGAGDTAGEGSQKLLGQPNISRQALLVRETAQNSWDARLPGIVPTFELRYRELDFRVKDLLRRAVFPESSPNLNLREALNRNALHAIEIVDRGTKGLAGPTRNDLQVAPGEPKDYADFVLTVGAPPDHFEGGGTYGFGKMASYTASRCSTVVIWSRTRDFHTGELIERFIASAMGPTFELDGRLYTGRQWWGLKPDDDGPARVDPVEGPAARELGSCIFERGFIGEETGTSILILDPFDGDKCSEIVRQWRLAVLSSLWPKLDPGQVDSRRMDIHLYEFGEQRELPDLQVSPVARALRDCLARIRAIQEGAVQESDPLIRTPDIRCLRPKRELGTLALSLVIGAVEGDPMESALDAVSYMRSGAELVVKVDNEGTTFVPNAHWVGVFKPMPDLDPAFAASEPPAHDNWSPLGVADRGDRKFVNVALREIREATKSYLAPPKLATTGEDAVSTGAVAAALAGLAGSSSGSTATARASKTATVKAVKPPTSRTPKLVPLGVTLIEQTPEDLSEHVQRTAVELELNSAAPAMARAGRLEIAVEGGTMTGDGYVVVDRWIVGDVEHDEESVLLQPGDRCTAVIAAPENCAIDVAFVAGVY